MQAIITKKCSAYPSFNFQTLLIYAWKIIICDEMLYILWIELTYLTEEWEMICLLPALLHGGSSVGKMWHSIFVIQLKNQNVLIKQTFGDYVVKSQQKLPTSFGVAPLQSFTGNKCIRSLK